MTGIVAGEDLEQAVKNLKKFFKEQGIEAGSIPVIKQVEPNVYSYKCETERVCR